jgi:hypothetical protein
MAGGDPLSAPLEEAGRSSSLPPGCREPSGLLPTRRWSPRTGLTLLAELERRRHVRTIVVLAGRATHLP